MVFAVVRNFNVQARGEMSKGGVKRQWGIETFVTLSTTPCSFPDSDDATSIGAASQLELAAVTA